MKLRVNLHPVEETWGQALLGNLRSCLINITPYQRDSKLFLSVLGGQSHFHS